jgi:hypothetical protein
MYVFLATVRDGSEWLPSRSGHQTPGQGPLVFSGYDNGGTRQTYEISGKEHLILQGKAITLQAWTGPEGSRRFRLLNCQP